MSASIRSVILTLFLFSALAFADPKLTNVHVKRTIDVASSIAISKNSIRMRNDGSEDASFFYFTVKCADAAGMGDLWAIPTGAVKSQKALQIESVDHVPGLDSCCSGFKIMFPEPLQPGKEIAIDVRIDTSGVIKSVPDTIQEHDRHYTQYSGNAYFFTPYKTEKMETVLIISSSEITSQHGIPEPVHIKGKRMTLGPYNNVEPLSKSEMSIRYYNGHGLIVARRAIKEFSISHWGSIATREEFEIENVAAKHQGEWSRVDHTTGFKSKYDTAVGDIWANLPGDADKVYYEDLVGNVTTSRLRSKSGGKRSVQLKFRYPLMGGWQNHFWILYELKLSNYIKSSGSQYEITLPIFPSLHMDLRCEELAIRVLLPEGAYGIEVQDHASLKFEKELSPERTSLTVTGRPVQTLRLKRIRSQSKHFKKITIRYKYNNSLKWVAPALVSIQIGLLLVACLVLTGQGYWTLEDEKDKKLKAI